jgi:pimeloyl-ACP methyl ester carboxylesterase
MPDQADSAILIHGLWMHGLVFVPHQAWLRKRGFGVRRFSYPSWSGSLDRNAEMLARFIAATPGPRIHLVCHSLGGLVALTLLGRRPDPRIRRLVLMGTPSTGCHCGRYMAERPAMSPFLGRSMKDWLARPRPAVPESVDIGIIAGTRRFGLGCVIPGLPPPNDGVVAVEETCLPEARDRIVLPVSHSGMLVSPACGEQAANFLGTGQFIHA